MSTGAGCTHPAGWEIDLADRLGHEVEALRAGIEALVRELESRPPGALMTHEAATRLLRGVLEGSDIAESNRLRALIEAAMTDDAVAERIAADLLAAAPAPTEAGDENERLRAEVHDLTGQVLYRTWMHDGPVAPPALVTQPEGDPS